MATNIEKYVSDMNSLKNVLIGLLIGCLAGVAGMLLFAPQSGKRTRTQIRQKSIELRDRSTDNLKNVLAKLRFNPDMIMTDVREKVGQLKHLGQDKFVKQSDNVSTALDAGKKAVEID